MALSRDEGTRAAAMIMQLLGEMLAGTLRPEKCMQAVATVTRKALQGRLADLHLPGRTPVTGAEVQTEE